MEINELAEQLTAFIGRVYVVASPARPYHNCRVKIDRISIDNEGIRVIATDDRNSMVMVSPQELKAVG